MSGARGPQAGAPGRGRRGHAEIEHTADLGFEVWGADPATLFVEATRALAEICYGRAAVRPRDSRPLELRGHSREELLVGWLQEVYWLLESERWLTADAEVTACTRRRVAGRLFGEAYDEARHLLHTEIKAVTYHGLRVGRGGDGLWRAVVVVDV